MKFPKNQQLFVGQLAAAVLCICFVGFFHLHHLVRAQGDQPKPHLNLTSKLPVQGPLDFNGPVPVGDPGEPVFDAIPGAESIPMLSGPEIVIVPADPNKPRAEQVEWRYISPFRIEVANYDSDKRILNFRIDPRLSPQTKERIASRLREVTGAPAQTSFRLNAVRLQAFTVELTLIDKKFVLRSENSGHDIANGPIPVLYRVKDDELHELLSTNLCDLTLTVRSTHPYAAFTRHTMQLESSMTAARDAIEKVLPKGMKLEDLEKHPLIVDRDSLLKVEQVLRDQFRIRTEGDPVKFAGIDKVFDKMLGRITVTDVPLHEVTRDMTDNFVMWDSKAVRLDVAANERTTLTREVEEVNEKRTAFKHAWDTMREEAQKTNDHKTWHKTLLDKMKLDTQLKIGIGIFGGSASMNLDKEHNQSDQGSDQALRETFDKMKNAGEMLEETFEKSYRKFKGEDFAKSAAGKILNLQRVTNFNLLSFRSAMLEHVERMSKGMLERVTFLPLEPSNTQQADALREIELMKEDILKLTAALAQMKRDELGSMKPWFSTKLPDGWVRADGVEKFPNDDWVPVHLRGQSVPDMRQQIIGGAKDLAQVGMVFKDGKVTVSGKNFELKNERTESPGVIQKDGVPVYGLMALNSSGMPHDGDEQRLLMNLVGVGFVPQYNTAKGLRMISWRYDKQLGGVAEIQLNDASSAPRHVMCDWIVYVGKDK